MLSELQEVMEGRHCSWHSINELLEHRLDQGDLEFIPVDGTPSSSGINSVKRALRISADKCSESTDDDHESLSWVAEDSEDSGEDINFECTEHYEFRDNGINDEL